MQNATKEASTETPKEASAFSDSYHEATQAIQEVDTPKGNQKTTRPLNHAANLADRIPP